MDTAMAQSIELAGSSARYDRCAKNIIGYRAVSAWILKTCAREFSQCDVKHIAESCISDVIISEKAVHQDHNDRLDGNERITALNSESSSVREGTIYYDVRFKATAPGMRKPIGLFINIEVQNEDDPGQKLLPRAEYYAARMISEQYGTVFTKGDYHKLEKVYSIWICPDPAQIRANGIFCFPRTLETVHGRSHFRKIDYDKSEYVVIFVGKPDNPGASEITDLLYTVFSADMSVEEKKDRLSSVYGIEMTEKIEAEVSEMCNLSSGIALVNRKKGRDEGRREGRAEGRILELIELVEDGLITVGEAAARSGMNVDEFSRKKEELKESLS
ncbi:MAG: hypothetical protein ACI4NM_06945 [Bullifex sp.]